MRVNIDKVVAVQNYGSSGTTLMQSLLDEHPDIISLPFLFGRNLYPIWDVHGTLPHEQLLSLLRHVLHYWFEVVDDGSGLDQMGENKDQALVVDEDMFFRHLLDYWGACEKPLSRKDFIVSFYVAYNRCYGNEFDDDAWLCYPIHGLAQETAKDMAADFKEMKILHMIREPIQTIGSAAKHIDKIDGSQGFHFSSFKGLLNCSVNQVLNERSMHWEARSSLCYGARAYMPDAADGSVESRGVRLEDVHGDAEKTMRDICVWLRIPWHAGLLMSTFMGLKWHNRKESIRQQGIGKEVIAQRYDQYMSPFDRERLVVLARPMIKAYGYELPKTMMGTCQWMCSIWWPFKMEYKRSRFKSQWHLVVDCFPLLQMTIFFRLFTGRRSPSFENRCRRLVRPVNFALIAPFYGVRMLSNYIGVRITMLKLFFRKNVEIEFVPLLRLEQQKSQASSEAAIKPLS